MPLNISMPSKYCLKSMHILCQLKLVHICAGTMRSLSCSSVNTHVLTLLVRAAYCVFLSNLSKKQVFPKPIASVTYLVLFMLKAPNNKVQKSRDEDPSPYPALPCSLSFLPLQECFLYPRQICLLFQKISSSMCDVNLGCQLDCI